jgi:hypothetical protein
MGTGSFPGVKQPGRDADHTPPSSAEVTKGYSYTFIHPLNLFRPVIGLLYLFTTYKTAVLYNNKEKISLSSKNSTKNLIPPTEARSLRCKWKRNTVQPRFTNASHHEQIGSRTPLITYKSVHERLSSRTNWFTNASYHEQIGSRTLLITKKSVHERLSSRTNRFTKNFPEKKTSRVTNGVSSNEHASRQQRLATSWEYRRESVSCCVTFAQYT